MYTPSERLCIFATWETGERLDFRRLVDGSHLGALSNGNHARLDVMLVADSVIRAGHGFEGELPAGGWKRHELAARELFRSAAFIGINMRQLGTEHGVKRPGEGLQTEHICGGAIEDEENGDIVTKVLAEFCHRRFRVGIVAVSDHMALVRVLDGLQRVGMHPGIVVAGKTSAWFHDR